jgi:hypothetical protein
MQMRDRRFQLQNSAVANKIVSTSAVSACSTVIDSSTASKIGQSLTIPAIDFHSLRRLFQTARAVPAATGGDVQILWNGRGTSLARHCAC